MNCDELFQMIEEIAPTVDKCKTGRELRDEADIRGSGISGTKKMKCLKRLMNARKVKATTKCVKTAKCYYDPPQRSNSQSEITATLEELEDTLGQPRFNSTAKQSDRTGFFKERPIRTWLENRLTIVLKEPFLAKVGRH